MIIPLICVLLARPAFAQTEVRPTAAQQLEEDADLQMARKTIREAIESYDEALRLDPKNAVLWNKVGIAHHQLNETSQAKADYEKAIQLNHKYPEAINNLGTIYFSEFNYKRAIRLYEQSLKLKPLSAVGFSNLGTALFARRKYTEATAAYQKALQLDPDVFEHHSPFSVPLQARTAQDGAMQYFVLARTYAAAKNQDKALEYLRKATEEGFHEMKKVYQDAAFADVIQSERFTEFIRNLPPSLPQ